MVQEIQTLTPNIGQERLLGALRSRELNVQQWGVMNCLSTLDPIGTALRWRAAIYRRKYSVPTLRFGSAVVRWHLVTHLCIDGYSCLIIYGHCCNDNTADRVLEQFVKGVNSYR